MTIVPLPAVGIRVVDMMIDPRGTTVEVESGKTYSTLRGRPKWALSLETTYLDRAEAQEVRAWWHDQVLGLNTFTAWHPEQPYPLLYPNGFAGLDRATGGAFDGTASVNALTTTGMTLTGLPDGFALKKGDTVGLEQTVSSVDHYGLYEIRADATADEDGILILSVHPFVTTSIFTTQATAKFDRALGEFKVEMGSYSGQRSPDLPPATFSARQVTY